MPEAQGRAEHQLDDVTKRRTRGGSRRTALALGLAALFFPVSARALDAGVAEKGDVTKGDVTKAKDCALGFLVFCALSSERHEGPESPARLELFGGYKFTNFYYNDEIRGCKAAGCSIDFNGPSFGLDVFFHLHGNPRSDDYAAVGISSSYMPIFSGIEGNARGFAGEFGQIPAGDGHFGYIPIRIALRRPNFLYLIKSKYMVSSFGVGLAIPVGSGVGARFTGAGSPKITIGGRLGAELPLSDFLRLGAVSNYGVVWYGSSFGESSFVVSYGVNLSYLL